MPTIWDWSTTAGNNATADADINWSEGQFPSTVNDSARQMMGRQAEWLKDNGVLTTAGTANAIAVVANSQVTTPPHGMTIAFRAAAANTGAATLSINGGSGLPLRKPKPGSASVADLEANDLTQGGVFIVHYDSAANEGVGSWVLINPTANQAAIGAALAAATAKTSPDDADFISGVQSGGTALFKITWENLKGAVLAYLQPLFDNRYFKIVGGVVTGDVQIQKNLPGIVLSSPSYANVYRIFANVSDTVDGGILVRRVGGDIGIADIGVGGFAFDGYGNLRARAGSVVYSGSAYLANDGNLSGSIWSSWGSSLAFQAISAQIERRAQAWAVQEGAAQTQTYLMGSAYPIGTYLFGIKSTPGTISTYGTIAGTDVDFSNAASAKGGGIGVGTWMVVGAAMSGTTASLLKRVG